MKRVQYSQGQKIGNCIYLKDSNPIISGGQKRRMAVFRCRCGDEFIAQVSSVKRGATKSCGCLKELKSAKHGLSNIKEYRLWINIKSRCNNPNTPKYKNHGGRGIRICEEWANDFTKFYDYISNLPDYNKPGLTLDRIENDGNYEPGNVRWADYHTQTVNARKQSNNTSGFAGVDFFKQYRKWSSRIKVRGVGHFLGYHNTIDQAVKARNDFIVNNNLEEYQTQEL